MESYKNPAYQRNYGFLNEEEQVCLMRSTVAIAGAGGDGFQLGYKLAMNGVRNFKVADPEDFEIENSNRVFGASVKNCGKNKAETFREMVLGIRPDAKIDIYTEGVNKDNIQDFMHGADLVLDETELTHLELGVMIAREARRIKIPDLLVMNIGFAALASSFRPEHGKTFEDMMGIPIGAPLDEVKDMKVNFSRCLAYLPYYGDINTLTAVEDGAPLPSISQGVDMASGLGSTQALLHLTSRINNHRRKPTWFSEFACLDAYAPENSGIIRLPRASYYLGAAAVISRCTLGLNPRGSYTKEERQARGQK